MNCYKQTIIVLEIDYIEIILDYKNYKAVVYIGLIDIKTKYEKKIFLRRFLSRFGV